MEATRLALFFGCSVSNQRPLLSSSVGWYTVHVSAYLKAFAVDGQTFASSVVLMSRRNSKRRFGIEPFGGLLKSTLDDFLRVDRDYLQLTRLLSKFKSIDHEKNISSCIAQVAALRGTFENRPVGGGKLDPRSVILIWDTGASYGLWVISISQ